MIESGEPTDTLQKRGIHRSELESAGGMTVLIYEGKQMVIEVPDSIKFTSVDINAKTGNIVLNAKNITINCNKLKINGDVEINGNFKVSGGIIRLN